MLSDRPYMRDDYQREKTSFLVWLLSALIAGFLVQSIADVWLTNKSFEHLMRMSAFEVEQWKLWKLVTYPLVQSSALSLLFVALGLFFIGREIAPVVGDRRLMWFTIGATITGALVWFGLHVRWLPDYAFLGASSILYAYLVLFGCLYPNREISFLLFFVIPVTTRPKYVAWVFVAISAFGLLFSELPVKNYLGMGGTPHSAHLGAMLAAWLYYRYVHASDFSFGSRPAIELPRWMKRSKKAAPAQAYQVNVSTPSAPAATPRDNIRAEVDRILDKINAKGFGSLTPEEKRVLDSAKDTLSRR